MKTAIITGITGQDGSYLAEFLYEKGYEIVGIKRRTSNLKSNINIQHLLDANKVTLIESDSTDAMSNNAILNKYKASETIEVYNLAAQSHVHTSFEQPAYTFQVNTLSVLSWLETIRQFDRSDRVKFYQAGTSEMFGNTTECPQNENTKMNPQSPYGISKVSAYMICKNYRDSYGLNIYTGILFNHESPRRGENFVTRKITMGLNNPPVVLGNLDSVRDWGHAKDYVRGMWMIMQCAQPQDFVLATGETHTIKDFIEEACRCKGQPIVRWIGNDGYDATGQLMVTSSNKYKRPCDVTYLKGDYSKAKIVLNWEPSISFADLVKEMVLADESSCLPNQCPSGYSCTCLSSKLES
jgi:GDPmannose 4,6-dehydratase